jgi:dodecin
MVDHSLAYTASRYPVDAADLIHAALVFPLTAGGSMSDHTYKLIELTGSSTIGLEEAIQNAISKAAKTVHNLHWFQVVDTRGQIEDGKVSHWQVTLKAGFRLDD